MFHIYLFIKDILFYILKEIILWENDMKKGVIRKGDISEFFFNKTQWIITLKSQRIKILERILIYPIKR